MEYAVLFSDEADTKASLPENYIVEYVKLRAGLAFDNRWKIKTQDELDSLLSQQAQKLKAFQEQDLVKRKNEAKGRKPIKDQFNLNVFSVPQQRELEKIIDLILNN